MANFLTKSVTGVLQVVAAIATSAGAADAGKIIETDANGLIDSSLLPPGTGNTVKEGLTAGEALTAGQFVYLDAAGEVLVADNTSITTQAQGFVLQNYALAATDVMVYFAGVNDAVTTTPGATYFLDTAGGITTTPPAFAVGSICHRLGVACGTNELLFENDAPVEYATQ